MGESVVVLRFSNRENVVVWVLVFGVRLFVFGVAVSFFSLLVFRFSWHCSCLAVRGSWFGKKVFLSCSFVWFERIIYFWKINLFFDCLVVCRKLVIFLRIFEV